MQEKELSLIDILYFLKDSYREIIIMIALGLLVSSIYLIATPKQYEATAVIYMTQHPTNPALMIEQPSEFVTRISQPFNISQNIIAACGLEGQQGAEIKLIQSLKWTIPSGANTSIELKVRRPEPGLAKICLTSIVDFADKSQTEIKRSHNSKLLDINSARLLKIDEYIAQDQDFLSRLSGCGDSSGVAYYSVLVNIRNLKNERDQLKLSIESNNLHKPAVISESETLVQPKNLRSLVTGAFGGLIIGLLIAFGRKFIPTLSL
jgi:hypothetical protein